MSTFPYGSVSKNLNLETVTLQATGTPPLNMTAANNLAVYNFATSGTVFLPQLSTVADGALVWVRNNGAGTVTVSSFAGDQAVPTKYATLATTVVVLLCAYKNPSGGSYPSGNPSWLGLSLS